MDVSGGLDSGGSLAEAVHLDDVVRLALSCLLRRPGVRRVGLALTEGGGRRLRFTARGCDEHPGRLPGNPPDKQSALEWCLIDAYDDVPLTSVVSNGEPILAELVDLDHRFSGMVEHQRQEGTVALAAVPLPGTGAPLGGLILFYDRVFGAGEREELTVVAAEVAAALVRLRAAGPRREQVLADEPTGEPAGEHARVGAVVVPAEPRAAGVARRFLRAQLGAWDVDDDVNDTAVLLLSELVTNAIIHTDAPAEVRAVLRGGELTVTVRDHGRPGDVAAAQPDHDEDPLRVHGRGLQLVEALSDRWGSERDAVGTTVWFALPT